MATACALALVTPGTFSWVQRCPELRLRAARPGQRIGWGYPNARLGKKFGATDAGSTPAQQFRTIRDEFKLPWDCVLHSCRHMFCTRLGEQGLDAFSIRDLAGHSSIMISRRYVHPTPKRLEQGIGLLESYGASTKSSTETQGHNGSGSKQYARVAELADAPDLGSGGATHGGSTPPFRTILTASLHGMIIFP